VIVLIKILTALISLQHLYILWFEMFAWESRGHKVFKKFQKEMFAPTKSLAANQGLYNGFLAAGLAWSLLIKDPVWSMHVAIFFLCCVAVAGIYGAVSAEKRIFFIQALPALIALALICFNGCF
jgi:putative membrane protein